MQGLLPSGMRLPFHSSSILSFCALALALVSCKKEDGTGGTKGSDNLSKEIRIGLVDGAGAAPIVIAQTQQFFKKQGLNVSLVPHPSTTAVVQSLATGNLEAGMVYPADALEPRESTSLIIPHILARNSDVLSVSATAWKAMQPGLLRDLEGQTVRPVEAHALALLSQQGESLPFQITGPTATSTYALCYWLAAAGITPNFEGQGGPLEAALSTTPSSVAVRGIATTYLDQPADAVPIIVTTDIMRDLPETALATRAEWSTAHEAALIRLVAALLQAGDWLDASKENRRLGAEAMASTLGLDPTRTRAWLTETFRLAGQSSQRDDLQFSRQASAAPTHREAVWILSQMARWGQITPPASDDAYLAIVQRVFEPRFHLAAKALLGDQSVREADLTDLSPLEADLDGHRFAPSRPAAYLKTANVSAP